ncbi:hypothetical protein AX15_004432 [Amanita polypyramis BW_CC]|nr:hypothetical protein AX15_004432 [Amanita polypyramis BW_CC]
MSMLSMTVAVIKSIDGDPSHVATTTMRYPISCLRTAALLLLITLTPTVMSCEKDCMSGVTNAFVGNYSYPVHAAISTSANIIASRMLPQQNYPLTFTPLAYLAPILVAWRVEAPAALEKAIFPSYFHGKCQVHHYAANGSIDGEADPPGCPNPDCPVVCGTPGSLVHFYPKLRKIAFDATREVLRNVIALDSDSYKQVEAAVLEAAQGDVKSRVGLKAARRRYKQQLRSLLEEIPVGLREQCGGSDLSECSWEKAMKEYILRFP